MYDSFGKYAFLGASAFAAGVINSIAGGGTLLTFPALLAALGPGGEVIANATSTVALVPGSLAGVGGYRREMRASKQWVKLLILPSILGGLAGSLLLTELPKEWFAQLVPWLILVAATLFMLQPAISRWVGVGGPDHHPSLIGKSGLVVFQFLVAVYGGYFGAGIGILMISSLSLMGISDIHSINGLKTFLAFCINFVSVVVFIMEDQVEWRYALAMMGCAIMGGYLGAHTARRMNRNVVRWIVVAIGFGLATYYFYSHYFQASN
jgi:uncharacterized membrane protein YfcA